MSRLNVVLLILLALQACIVAVQLIAGGGEAPTQAGPFLDGLSVASVQQVALSDGENAVTLRRTDEGFGVEESSLYPADEDKTSQLLQDLVAITTRETISRSDAHHVDLEVADDAFNRRVEVTTADASHTFFVGKAGRGGATYVRRAGEDAVFAVTEFSPHKLSARPAAWLDRVVFEAERDRIFAIDVRNSAGAFRLERRTLAGWQLAEDPDVGLDASEVDKLLGKAASVRLKEVAGRADEIPLGATVAEITIHVADQALPVGPPPAAEPEAVTGSAHTLRIAPSPDDDKTFLMRVDDRPYAVQTTSWSVLPLLEASVGTLAATTE